MAEDLLDYWVRLIKRIFPANAWINSLFSNDDYLIQVDWSPQNDSESPTKRSKIAIIIKEQAINDYLDKSRGDRELSDIRLEEFICERYNHFISENHGDTNQHALTEKWLISKDVMNRDQGLSARGEI
ncbi:MAG: hypothetical protein LLG97_07995 [Deltaproteobacteria bacterium]|nr:hypothetical protein [Deltaproteobacteria bacterium]